MHAETSAETSFVDPVTEGYDCAFSTEVLIELDRGGETEASRVAQDLAPQADGCNHVQVGTPGGLRVSAAAAAEISGYKTFTLDSPSFSKSNSHGKFDAQVTYSNSKLPVAFGFKLSAGLRAIATGTVTAKGARAPGNCSYSKKSVAASYSFHWSCPTHAKNKRYDWAGSYVFRVNVGGNNGTATVTNRFGYVITTVRG